MGEYDVAIIGAGVIGGSIAYELASRGASVTVLDSRTAGQGATQAAAGMLGAEVVLGKVGASGRRPVHDPLRLATAYHDIFGNS